MCDCEMPSCCVEGTPRARKRHRCCECRGWIEAGERYELITGVWDGRGQSFKTCLQCSKLRNEVSKETGCCVSLGQLDEEFYDGDIVTRQAQGRARSLFDRFTTIRIQRGAAICQLFKEEENDLEYLST